MAKTENKKFQNAIFVFGPNRFDFRTQSQNRATPSQARFTGKHICMVRGVHVEDLSGQGHCPPLQRHLACQSPLLHCVLEARAQGTHQTRTQRWACPPQHHQPMAWSAIDASDPRASREPRKRAEYCFESTILFIFYNNHPAEVQSDTQCFSVFLCQGRREVCREFLARNFLRAMFSIGPRLRGRT